MSRAELLLLSFRCVAHLYGWEFYCTCMCFLSLEKTFEKTFILNFDKSASIYKEEEKLDDLI